MSQRKLLDEDDAETQRCRRVREELGRRYKTPEAICAWVRGLEKQDGTRAGKAWVRGKARSPSRNGKPAQGRPIEKI
ncbi:MAG: hypothetical protein ABSE73_04565 [Planctomycetota bacterium]